MGIVSDRWSRETNDGMYGLGVAVYNFHRMQILQTACRFRELQGISGLKIEGKTEIGRTIRRRLTSGCFDVKSIMFPSIIHSVMTHNGDNFGETPSTGRGASRARCLGITLPRIIKGAHYT